MTDIFWSWARLLTCWPSNSWRIGWSWIHFQGEMKELNHLRKQIYRFFVCFKGITLNQYPISKGLFSLSVGSPCKQNNPPRHPFEARARARHVHAVATPVSVSSSEAMTHKAWKPWQVAHLTNTAMPQKTIGTEWRDAKRETKGVVFLVDSFCGGGCDCCGGCSKKH